MAKSELKKSSKKAAKVEVSKKDAKKAKQLKKEEPSSESDSSSDSDSDSDSDSSSDEEEEKKKKDSSDSDSSSDEEEEKKKKDSSDSDSSSDEEEEKKKKDSSDSDSSSDEEEEKKKEESSDSDSSDSSDSNSDSSSDEEEEEEKKEETKEVEEPSKKRKAEDIEESDEPSKAPKEQATIFVGRLAWSVDDAWLQREFEAIGGVLGARVMTERDTGRSRGYGYVDFESKESAEKAIAEMQGKEIDGRPINLDMSTSKPKPQGADARSNDRAKRYGDTPSQPSDTLFIGNLSFQANRDSLREAFEQHGTVLGVRIPTNPETEQPKGFGYVQFGSVDEATAALTALNGEYLDGRPVRLDYSAPRDNNNSRQGTPTGGRGGFGGRGGRGGFGGDRGGRGGFGGRGGRDRPSGSGANSIPVAFKGTKKTFD